MSRSLTDLIKDYESNPAQWEIIRTEAVPSTNRRNRGGLSIQELLRHRTTGEQMVRHTLRRADGTIFAAPHFRPDWK
jgi:hypothetical protein